MSLGFLSGTNSISMQANEKEAGVVCDKPDARKTDVLDCQQRKTTSPTKATLKTEKYI